MKNLKLTIFGEVQGIGFRFEARRLANSLGLTGFVRNEPDGSLYIEIEGGEDGLEKFLEWCKFGPDAARVSDIHREESDELKKYDDFLIE